MSESLSSSQASSEAPVTPVLGDIILAVYPGPVVRIDGVCYEFIAETQEPVTHEHESVYPTCAACEESSSSSGPSSSSSSE